MTVGNSTRLVKSVYSWSSIDGAYNNLFMTEMERAASVEALLFSAAPWIKHGAVIVRTKALIIHFPVATHPMLKPQTVPAL